MWFVQVLLATHYHIPHAQFHLILFVLKGDILTLHSGLRQALDTRCFWIVLPGG
jgi:hypothetical protein